MEVHKIIRGYDLSQISNGDLLEWPGVYDKEIELVRYADRVRIETPSLSSPHLDHMVTTKTYRLSGLGCNKIFKGEPHTANTSPLSIDQDSVELNNAGML